MSILASLTLSEVSKKSESTTPHLNLRRKMVAAIDEQIAGAAAEAAGQHFSKTVEKVVKNAETGTAEKRAVERSLRRWWWRAADGVHLELRFGNRAINPSSPPIGAPHANLTILAANFRGSAPSRSPTPIVVP